MFAGFKQFILRGNVVELAVAVIIGAAFTAIVSGLVEGIFNPLIALLFDSSSLAQAGLTLRPETATAPAVVLSWGRVLSAIIQFVLVATVIYFAVVYPMNLMKRRADERKAAADAAAGSVAAATATDVELLAEIRDLLKAQSEPAKKSTRTRKDP